MKMEEINGFRMVKLETRRRITTHHTLFMKANSIRKEDPDKPAKRTLFVINVPPYVTEENLRFAFGGAGEITNVICQEKLGPSEENTRQPDKFNPHSPPSTFKVAYIVFKSTKSLEEALKLSEISLCTEKGKSTLRMGLSKWMQEYVDSIHPEDKLQAEIDEYMTKFDTDEKAAQLAEKSAAADNDGWITITKHGPVAGFEQKESVINKLEEKIEKKRKDKELKNFYTFQIRESKMQHIVGLRKKFEEDKRKIERLKESRRFNPFSK